MTETWLRTELERIHDRLRAEDRARRATEREAELRAQVAAYLTDHPDASGTEVAREAGGRKQDVLRLVRDHKQRFPVAGNRTNGGTCD